VPLQGRPQAGIHQCCLCICMACCAVPHPLLPANPSLLQVATPEDPASARRGESLYAFFPRTILGNLVDGLGIEAQRLAASGTSLLSLQNRWVGAEPGSTGSTEAGAVHIV
jgi:hypothetical protein